MATLSRQDVLRSARASRRGARTMAASAVSLLPLFALAFATLETAIVFTGENVLRALGLTH